MAFRSIDAVALPLVAALVVFGTVSASSSGASAAPRSRGTTATHSDTLITEPDAGMGPLDAFMASAQHSVDMSMYELADQQAESILAADDARGVHVRVVLDQHRERARNRAAFGFLSAHRVAVHWAPDVDKHVP